MKGKIDVYLFYGFLFTLPLSIRKVLWYRPLHGAFNEYADISLYLSDIMLMLALGAWFLKERHDLKLMSIARKCFTWNTRSVLVGFPVVLILWSIASLLWARDSVVGIFFVCKLIELYGLYLFTLFHIVPHGTYALAQKQVIFRKVLGIFILAGVLESSLSIGQFMLQHSLGLTFLRESILQPSSLGVAKIILDGDKYIRAYGTFPHPNILGGFLCCTILLSHMYFKMFHVEQEQGKLMYYGVLLIQIIGLGVSFSKSAILGFLLSVCFIVIVSRGTKHEYAGMRKNTVRLKKFNFKHVFSVAILVVGAFVCTEFYVRVDKDALLFQSLRERVLYQQVAFDVIHNHPILGISCGQLVIFMAQQTIYPLYDWQLQPVHNVFLLIWAELGVIGFFIFTMWYITLVGSKLKHTMLTTVVLNDAQNFLQKLIYLNVYARAALIGFLPILIADHYLWDIQQGQLLFWIVCGLSAGLIIEHKNTFLTIKRP